jgi:hypothetical protein
MRGMRRKGSQVATKLVTLSSLRWKIFKSNPYVKNAGGLIISFSVTPAFVASVTLTLSIESG